MKWLAATLFLLLPLCTFSQGEKPYQNGVGLSLTQNANDGLGISLRYRYQIKNKGIAKFEINSNRRSTFIVRLGYEPLRLQWKKLEWGLGLDLKYERNDYSKFGGSSSRNLALEFPIEFRFNITEEYSIYSGLSFSQQLTRQSSVFSESTSPISEIRLGIGYNF